MVVYVNNNDEVIWINEDDSVKEMLMDDENCILVDKDLKFVKYPKDGFIYIQKFNRDTQEIYAEKTDKMYKEKPTTLPVTLEDIKEDTLSTKEVTLLTSEDALTIIEYITNLEEKMDIMDSKLDKIMRRVH